MFRLLTSSLLGYSLKGQHGNKQNKQNKSWLIEDYLAVAQWRGVHQHGMQTNHYLRLSP